MYISRKNKEIIKNKFRADAQLILVAPEMLECLIDIYKEIPFCNCDKAYKDRNMCDPYCFRCNSWNEEDIKKVKNIIEKATGMTIEEVLQCER